ncbi:ankyrin repeat-containing protein NPR4-like [Miscanthus floridulus]|uniref:ankyrin repeat-containing protein NPR4-like n=1 Tax=Miscanthus floridulus TaxID=154761 RepID=UPI0034590FF8
MSRADEKPTPTCMHPLLAEAACRGNWEEITYLLESEEDLHGHSSKTPSKEFLDKLAAYSTGNHQASRSSAAAMQPAPADVEQGIGAVPRRLIKGVTMEGDTALHLVAANGDDSSFLKCAVLIHGKDKDLLWKQNDKGDTPLHCAARTGRSEMVSHLVVLATGDNIVEELLRQENNSNETVLHMAVGNGDHQLVKHLLAKDPKLACFPEKGTSPLYLAILLEKGSIARILYDESENNVLSYSGPNGQNALHAAVLRGPVLTRMLLEWNTSKKLTTETDENGSTPLHFAAGLRGAGRRGSPCAQVFNANTAVLYQPDNNGLSPIHVAVAAQANVPFLYQPDNNIVWLWAKSNAIPMFVKKCPSSAGLRDAKGRTFLHVAVEKKNAMAVLYACRSGSLAWIMNMQDREGNTALHLAVKDGSNLRIFRGLFGSTQVNLNLTNAENQTPLDIALYQLRPSFYDATADPEIWITRALKIAGATRGVSRMDHFYEEYENHHGVNSDYKDKELEMLKNSTQSQSIGSVLIATVTFGAMFALPGGYRADDHHFGGTPTLAGTYAFHAFMIANTIAFICSTIATLGFMFAGSAKLSLVRRKIHFDKTTGFMHNSIMALTIAFALGVYTVLAPVAQFTAILICAWSPLVVLYNFADLWLNLFRFALPLRARKGTFWTLRWYTYIVLVNLFSLSGISIVIFVWTAYGMNHPIISISPAQAPARFT